MRSRRLRRSWLGALLASAALAPAAFVSVQALAQDEEPEASPAPSDSATLEARKRVVGKIALWKSLLTAFLFAAIMFVTFDLAFDVIMPKGPLEAAFGY